MAPGEDRNAHHGSSVNGDNGARDNGCPMKPDAPAQPAVLSNLTDGKVLFDTLHQKASGYKDEHGNSCCQADLCQGSIMYPMSGPERFTYNRTVDNNNEMLNDGLKDIDDFYKIYFEHIGRVDKRRLKDVKTLFRADGTYHMTYDELDFASKMAWRNAPRCVGRIQWSKLKLFDCRHVETTDELAECIFEQLDWATNHGNLRSSTLVTAAVGCGTQFRIWNPQYLQYAGYKIDGNVLGDPANVELTEIALLLGWTPPNNKKGRFDVLPLILQREDENPVWYTIPDELCLQVPLKDNDFPKFNALGLKWYGMPAVTGMNLHAGGLLYKFTTFNGWYMSTEVLRDFCDLQRYNMLKEIAEGFEFDTSKPAYLWKDLASIRFNIAIIASYKERGVNIVDQHFGCETFMTFLENEQKARGGCPCDWVWINPPISGSLTPVFHQEMINYRVKPYYDYQAKPWIGFKWKGALSYKNRKRRLTLKAVARAIMVCCKLMNVALKERLHCTIIYATETGMSERFALQLSTIFDQKFSVEVILMNNYDMSRLNDEGLLLIIVSTFGNGEAPSNGKLFEQKLLSDRFMNSLKDGVNLTNYAVFGLGSSSYPIFCGFAKKLDETLAEAGCHRLIEPQFGDDQGNQEGAFNQWCADIYKVACNFLKVEGSTEVSILKNEYHVKNTYISVAMHKGLGSISRANVLKFTVKENKLLTPEFNGPGTYMLRFKTDQVEYEAGDHLAIFPRNDAFKVNMIRKRTFSSRQVNLYKPIRLDNEGNVNVQHDHKLYIWISKFAMKGGSGYIDLQATRIPRCTLKEALINYLDIEAPPTQSNLQAILRSGKIDERDKEKFTQIATDEEMYITWIKTKRCSWPDMLEEFPSLQLNIDDLLSDLSLLRPRYYSISSCDKTEPNEVVITTSVLRYHLEQAPEVEKNGLCSNFLSKLSPGQEMHAFVKESEFRLPPHHNTTIIMISAGSGIAPFRAFWKSRQFHRQNQDDSVSRLLLYFGCRDRSVQLYKEEIEQMVTSGVIDQYRLAFSRSRNHPKHYVQDLLIEDSDHLKKLLIDKEAYVYVCGDIKMATGVSGAIERILAEKSTFGKYKLKRYNSQLGDEKVTLDLLRKSGRYQEDIYSIIVQD